MSIVKSVLTGTIAASLSVGGASFLSAQNCPPCSPPGYLQQIVWAHAPVVLEEAYGTTNVAKQDHLLRVDFDGDNLASDARASADAHRYYNVRPTIYYSIVETDDAYYIGYYTYHVTDGGVQMGGIEYSYGHDNDLEGFWIVVWKGGPGLAAYGTELWGLTNAHGGFLPSYSASYWSSDPGVFIAGQRVAHPNALLHWTDPNTGFLRPVIAIRASEHGTYPARSLDQNDPHPDLWCDKRLNSNPPPDARCGIFPDDFGPGGIGSVNSGYEAAFHSDANLITYWPWYQAPCTLTDGCSAVQALPIDQSTGSWYYNLVSMVDSPMWTTRSSPGMQYGGPLVNGGYLVQFRGGESGYGCYLQYDPNAPCGAQPPWAWDMRGICELEEGKPCWRSFGADMTEVDLGWHGGYGSIGAGSILDQPDAVVNNLWQIAMSPTYIYNPFRPGYTPPTILPLSATIYGPGFVNNDVGTWTANVTGGYPGYTYVWTGDFGEVDGPSLSTYIDHAQYIYLDVYDSQGNHTAAQMYVTQCDGNQVLCT